MDVIWSSWPTLVLLGFLIYIQKVTCQANGLLYQQNIFYPESEDFRPINHGYHLTRHPAFFSKPHFKPILPKYFTSAGNIYQSNPHHSAVPLLPSGDLFSPAADGRPAETPGQVQEYRKALEEERKEKEQEALKEAQDLRSGGYDDYYEDYQTSQAGFLNTGQQEYARGQNDFTGGYTREQAGFPGFGFEQPSYLTSGPQFLGVGSDGDKGVSASSYVNVKVSRGNGYGYSYTV